MKKRTVGLILKRLILTIFVAVLIIALPSVNLAANNDLSKIYEVFLGSKSKYQGIIEIWNIDSFESGIISKQKFLTDVSEKFKSKNKGLYFMIRNLTETECVNLLNQGKQPDLISCSFGVAEKFKEYVCGFDFAVTENIDISAMAAGNVDGEQVGIPWCKNGYFVFSTKDKLTAAKVEDYKNKSLSDICLDLGYTTKTKKGEKVIYSVSFGNKKYLMPFAAIKSYNKIEADNVLEYSFNKERICESAYSAYSDFISDKSVCLIGSQRDVFRLENRINNGKICDVVYEQIDGFTDMIQFMMLSKNLQGNKKELAQNFVKFLISSDTQRLVYDIGLFPVNKVENLKSNEGIMQNIIPQNFEDYSTLNIFVSENQIKQLQ